MLSSLFARRFTVAFVATAHPLARPVVARRTLFATPPSAKTAEGAAHKTASQGTSAKRGRPPKNPVEHQKHPKQEKQRVRVPKNLKPPKRAPGPYFLFCASFVKSQPQAATVQDFRELTKRAGEIWRGYSMAEKQPFYDENEARKEQAKREREEFFRNISISELKQLNAIRKAQGKTKYHSTNKSSIPLTPFILFSSEFRNSPDGHALINETSPEKKYAVRATVAAADRWRSMSPEEKAPYFERYRKAKDEMKAEHLDS